MHSPIQATFHWKRIYVEGPVLIKPAPLVLDDLCKHDDLDKHLADNASALWHMKYQRLCDFSNSEDTWSHINQFAIDT